MWDERPDTHRRSKVAAQCLSSILSSLRAAAAAKSLQSCGLVRNKSTSMFPQARSTLITEKTHLNSNFLSKSPGRAVQPWTSRGIARVWCVRLSQNWLACTPQWWARAPQLRSPEVSESRRPWTSPEDPEHPLWTNVDGQHKPPTKGRWKNHLLFLAWLRWVCREIQSNQIHTVAQYFSSHTSEYHRKQRFYCFNEILMATAVQARACFNLEKVDIHISLKIGSF